VLAKVCSRCRESKLIEAFHRDATKPDSHRAMCAECVREAQNARDTARATAAYRFRVARDLAYHEWRFYYGGRLDFEAWWEREKGGSLAERRRTS
jgi:hypothetical protein